MTRPKLYKDKARLQIVMEASEAVRIKEHILNTRPGTPVSTFVLEAVREKMNVKSD